MKRYLKALAGAEDTLHHGPNQTANLRRNLRSELTFQLVPNYSLLGRERAIGFRFPSHHDSILSEPFRIPQSVVELSLCPALERDFSRERGLKSHDPRRCQATRPTLPLFPLPILAPGWQTMVDISAVCSHSTHMPSHTRPHPLCAGCPALLWRAASSARNTPCATWHLLLEGAVPY